MEKYICCRCDYPMDRKNEFKVFEERHSTHYVQCYRCHNIIFLNGKIITGYRLGTKKHPNCILTSHIKTKYDSFTHLKDFFESFILYEQESFTPIVYDKDIECTINKLIDKFSNRLILK